MCKCKQTVPIPCRAAWICRQLQKIWVEYLSYCLPFVMLYGWEGIVWATFSLFPALFILFSFNLFHLFLALLWQCPSFSCSQQPLRCIQSSPGSKRLPLALLLSWWQYDKEKRCLCLMVWMSAVLISVTLLAKRWRGLTCPSSEYWTGLPEVVLL